MQSQSLPGFKALLGKSWQVSWPMTLIMSFEFIIGITDIWVAGRMGSPVQAAYGVAFQVYFIFMVMVHSFTVGTVSVISRIYGQNSLQQLRESVSTAFWAAFIGGVLFFCLAYLSAPFAIAFFNLPSGPRTNAESLLKVFSFGLAFHYLLINSNGILRSCGLIRKSLLTMSAVCLLNIALNLFFLFKTQLGPKGIALATVLAVALGSMINLPKMLALSAGHIKIDPQQLGSILRIGFPMLILQLAWQLGSVTIFSILARIKQDNIAALAAFTNGLRIESAIFLPAFAFNLANAVIVGNLLGENKQREAYHNGIVTAACGAALIVLLSFLVIIYARPISSSLSDNPAVIQQTVLYLSISLLFEPLMAWGVILGGGLNGAGDTLSVMKYVSLSVWLVRIPLGYFFGVVKGMGPVAIWWSMNVSIVLQTFLFTRRYLSKAWLVEHSH